MPGPDDHAQRDPSRPADTSAGHRTPPADPGQPAADPQQVAWLPGSELAGSPPDDGPLNSGGPDDGGPDHGGPADGGPVIGERLIEGPAPGLAWSFGLDLGEILAAAGATQIRPEDVTGPRATDDPDGQEASFALELALLDEADEAGIRRRDLTGVIAEHLPAGAGLAAWLSQADVGELTDYDLPGIAAAARKLASWAAALELASVAEMTSRAAARDPKVAVDDDGRPGHVSASAGAEVSLALTLTHYGAMDEAYLAADLRWRLPATGAALSAGIIDLARARIISDGLAVLADDQDAARAEAMVLPRAGELTTAQLRAAVNRAVIKVDPRSADERQAAAARRAKVTLHADSDGTAALVTTKIPGVLAAAAMARLTAMARALIKSGAGGGIDLARAQIHLGLLLGTLPTIPPPPGAPPDAPPDPADSPGPDCPAPHDDSAPDEDSAPDNVPPPDTDDPGPNNPGPDDDPGPGHGDDPGPNDPGAAGGDPTPPAPGLQPPRAGPSRAGPRPDPGLPRAHSSGASPCPGRGADAAWPEAGPWEDAPILADPDVPPDDNWSPGWKPPPRYGSNPDDDDDQLTIGAWPGLPTTTQPPPAHPRPGQPSASDPPAGPHDQPAATDTSARDRDEAARRVTGLLDLELSWAALTGDLSGCATLSRLGPITATKARLLALLASFDPHAQWRLILTDHDGRAIAVERVRRGPQPARPPGITSRVTVTFPAALLDTSPALQPDTAGGIQAAILRAAHRARARARQELAADAAAPDGCAHATASAAYRPPPRIRELVHARDRTCRQPTCRQPATHTDLDHTTPHHAGGRTCKCNLGPFCRLHHQVKQEPGWHVTQPQPGHFTITTPAGRTYTVEPDTYPA